jgi:hypothetical protein
MFEEQQEQYAEEMAQAQDDLKTFTDEDFEHKYKATKRFYRAISKSLEWLQEAIHLMEKPNPLDIDIDVIEDAEMTVEDFMRLMERMHMAAYWKGEEE